MRQAFPDPSRRPPRAAARRAARTHEHHPERQREQQRGTAVGIVMLQHLALAAAGHPLPDLEGNRGQKEIGEK